MSQRIDRQMGPKLFTRVMLALCVFILSACATKKNPDPMESWNRQVFEFNDGFDRRVMKPVAQAYQNVTPQFMRVGVSNFFGNFKDMWATTNLFLQGRPGDGTRGVMRVGINSTLGLAGVIDIASPMGLYRFNEDLGQTFGVWGMEPGPYIVWPIFGPSTLRDSLGLPGEIYFSPTMFSQNAAANNRLRFLSLTNTRANLLGATGLLDDVALDPYAFVRAAYLQRRQNLVYNGDPPDEGESEEP